MKAVGLLSVTIGGASTVLWCDFVGFYQPFPTSPRKRICSPHGVLSFLVLFSLLLFLLRARDPSEDSLMDTFRVNVIKCSMISSYLHSLSCGSWTILF